MFFFVEVTAITKERPFGGKDCIHLCELERLISIVSEKCKCCQKEPLSELESSKEGLGYQEERVKRKNSTVSPELFDRLVQTDGSRSERAGGNYSFNRGRKPGSW